MRLLLPPKVAVLLVLWAGASTHATGAPEEESRLDRDAFLAKLVPVLVEGIGRTDTQHPVFHGDVDWHSAVHGHWAILRIARATGKHEAAAEGVVRRLDAERLAAEARYLRENPSFEQPYGRAWFLRLAIEFERWSVEKAWKDPERLRAMASQVARSLREHLAAGSPSPATPEYANPCWALAQLYAWYAFTKDDQGVAWVAALVREHLLAANPAPSWGRDVGAKEFFSLFGNWAYLVARTQDAATLMAFLDAHPLPTSGLPPVPIDGTVAHHFGMNWSRAWALAALARASPRPEDPDRFRKAFDAHVAAAARDHTRFAGDFWAYDHWVPQFAVYALTDD